MICANRTVSMQQAKDCFSQKKKKRLKFNKMDSYLICLVFSGLVLVLVCFVVLGVQRNFQVPSLVKCHCLSDCSFIFCWILCEPFILFIQLFFTKLVLFYFISFAVILSNYYDLPFNDILDWQKFSVVLKESDVYQLKQILKDIPDEKFLALHKNLIKVKSLSSTT